MSNSLKRKIKEKKADKKAAKIKVDVHKNSSGSESESGGINEYQDDFGSELELDSDSGSELDLSSDGEGDADQTMEEGKAVQHGKNKTKRKGALPTIEELSIMKEAPMLFKSNIFMLHTEELLKESRVEVQSAKTKRVEEYIKKISAILEKSTDIAEIELEKGVEKVKSGNKHRKVEKEKNSTKNSGNQKKSGKGKKHNESNKESINEGGEEVAEVVEYVNPYFAEIPKDYAKNLKVGYKKPEQISIVGSFGLGMAADTREGFGVDIAIKMPDELFTDKDCVNYRYFYKRAFYLQCVMSELLKDKALAKDLGFRYSELRGDKRITIIEGTLKHKNGGRNGGIKIRLIPTISSTLFARQKFSPEKNNVRGDFIKKVMNIEKVGKTSVETETETEVATPLYNTAMVAESQYFTHLKYLYETSKQSESFRDAVVLSKVWLSQRKFGGEMNGFILTMILAWLINGSQNSGSGSGSGSVGNRNASILGRISGNISSYQLFRSLMVFIRDHFRDSEGIEMGYEPVKVAENLPQATASYEMSKFKAHFDNVFADPTGQLNLLAGVDKWEIMRIKQEARMTLELLDAGIGARFNGDGIREEQEEEDVFFKIFINNKTQSILNFDYIYTLKTVKNPQAEHNINNKRMDMANDEKYFQNQVYRILKAGLQNRTTLIYLMNTTGQITVGINVNPQEAMKLVELGPIDAAQKDKFVNLWGSERAELRRFKDGSIRICTVWNDTQNGSANNNGGITHRLEIITQMIDYLLTKRHFAATTKHSLYIIEKVTKQIDQLVSKAKLEMATNEHLSVQFVDFTKRVYAINEELPLQVTSIKNISPYLRATSIAPYTNNDKRHLKPVVEVVFELEGSTKWPENNLLALYKVKTAMLLKVGQVYKEKYGDDINIACKYHNITDPNQFNSKYVNNRLLTSSGSAQHVMLWLAELQRNMDDLWLEILDENVVYKIYLKLDREKQIVFRLLRLLSTNNSIKTHYTQALLKSYLNCYTQTFDFLPALHHKIEQLNKKYYPTFSLTVKLFKKWLSSHFLLATGTIGYETNSFGTFWISEELAELIVAHVFIINTTSINQLNQSGDSVPSHNNLLGSYTKAFINVLHFLASFDCSSTPLVIRFDSTNNDDNENDNENEAGTSTSADAGVRQQTILNSIAKTTRSKSISATNKLISESFATLKATKKNLLGALQVYVDIEDCSCPVSVIHPTIINEHNANLYTVLSSLTAHRLMNLASSCLTFLDTNNQNIFFNSPLSHYDFVLFINPAYCANSFSNITSTQSAKGNTGKNGKSNLNMFKNIAISEALSNSNILDVLDENDADDAVNNTKNLETPTFDTISSLRSELDTIYHKSAIFFHDVYHLSQNVIAGLWTPLYNNKTLSFNANVHTNIAPISLAGSSGNNSNEDGGDEQIDSSKFQLNKLALLNEMLVVSGDILVDYKLFR
ncbi:Nucleolar protein 6 [Zancudomyces culisetae]|uniref:Nucleolar protein 6 n=1 Tax=Zancudomyces culisetae TaxID=1213189 RepID=A0A1R1PGG7_ZANCU|nr:Nucleolar protein 6 [Zancudomyces culisetae]|eukprot:OMH80074.1 Nucleolar protein 6 [Zancudomyces culisetae]